MSNSEKQLARAEAIIDALISENRTLKEKIARFESGYGFETRFSSTPNNKSGTDEHLSSIPKIGNEAEIHLSSTPKNDNGTETLYSSIPNFGNGSDTDFTSIPKNENGIGKRFSSTHKSENGISEHFSSTPKSGSGSETPTTPLPDFINPTLYIDVATQLSRAGINYVRGRFLINTARLIIHFHNNNPSDYSTLQKLTALSHGGLSKNMSAMRRRGIIVNSGFQQYKLTEWSKNVLRKAVLKT
jgi:hypothetical protein